MRTIPKAGACVVSIYRIAMQPFLFTLTFTEVADFTNTPTTTLAGIAVHMESKPQS